MATLRTPAPRAPTAPRPRRLPRFAAIDFETADFQRDSACAVGVVVVDGGEIVRRHYTLLRPPRRAFQFTYIHGIAWKDVADKPTFAEHWAELAAVLEGAEFFAAHNAPFDRSVLRACTEGVGLAMPVTPFRCTVQLARDTWALHPAKLPDVCAHLGITLKHHDAMSDAEACARIVMAAQRAGAGVGRLRWTSNPLQDHRST